MKRNLYIIGAMATLAFTSCQQDELGTDFNSDPSAVRVNATVGEGINITRSNPTGDATTQKVFNAGDKISVSADEQMAVTYTRTADGKWSLETNRYLRWNTPSMTFTAYYPTTVGTDAQYFDLPTDQSDLAKIAAADYMTFSGSKAKTEAHTVDIAMQRKTARVIVHIAGFNDQYTTGYSVSAASVSGNTSGYNTGGTTTGAVTVSAYKATDTDFYALLTPTTADGEATFITLAVTDGTTTDELTVKGIPALEAGKSYTYNVSVGKNYITIGSVTVKEWGDEVVIPGGEASPVQVSPATHTITAAKPGFITANDITTALAGGTVLAVKGEIDNSDLTKLTAATTLTTIDLREATYTGGTIPSATWGGALKRILIRYSDRDTYKAAWSSVSDKLFYTGKEITHLTIPSIVYDVNLQGYKLISKGFFGSNDKDWATADAECIAKGGRLPNSVDDIENLILTIDEVTSVMKQSISDLNRYYYFWCEDMHSGDLDYRRAFFWDIGYQRFSVAGGKPIAQAHHYFIVFDVQ